MKIIENPTQSQLQKIQSCLDGDASAGITNIWADINSVYFLALASGNEAGVISLREFDDFAEIYKLYVPQNYRRLKIGRELFLHAISYLRSRGITKCCVEAVGDSHLFWNSELSNFNVNMIDDNKGIISI